MPDSIKVLGQSAPAADTDTTIYTVPGATAAVSSTITVCNRAGTGALFRIAVSPGGAGLANQHYIYYDAPIPGNSTFAATIGLSLATTDVVRVRANSASVSFSLFGTEIS